MKHTTRKLAVFLLTLTLVMGMMAGMSIATAESQEQTESFLFPKDQKPVTLDRTNIKITGITDNMVVQGKSYPWPDFTIESKGTAIITQVVLTCTDQTKDKAAGQQGVCYRKYANNQWYPSATNYYSNIWANGQTSCTIQNLGATKVRIDAGNNVSQIKLTSVVVYYTVEVTPVDGVTLYNGTTPLTADDTITLSVGGSKQLTATVSPDGATYKDVTWSSSNANVASVASNGTVTGKAEGTVTITVTANNGTPNNTSDDKTASCKVKVHAHNYTVNVSDATATVSCTDDCPNQKQYTATLSAESRQYNGETLLASMTKSNGFPTSVQVSAITYKDKKDNAVDYPIDVGEYTASVTVGNKTISKSFSINGLDPVTYTEGKSKKTVNQYILVPNKDGFYSMYGDRVYVVKGNVNINGGLIYRDKVKLLILQGSSLTVNGIKHDGSELLIYPADGEEGAAIPKLLVNGPNGEAALSGNIANYGCNITITAGTGGTIFAANDMNLTLDSDVSIKELTGGSTQEDGSVKYSYSELTSLNTLSLVRAFVNAKVATAPTANALTYNGKEQALVTAGAATGGEMQYALGTATEATQPYTTSIPTATDAGTYYVWYKVKGNANHNDSKAACVKVTIAAKPHEHTWGDWEVTKKATCVAKGEKKRTCSECKKEETAEIAIDPNNHTGRTEIKGKKDATESAEGYTGDTYCKDCGKKLKSGKAIPKLEKKQEEKTEPQKEEKKPFTDFRTLRLTASKRSKDAITLKWRKYADADGYLVYGCKCGEKSKMKLLKTIKGNKNVTWTHKKLKKGTYYKYKVVAYKNNKGKKKTLVNSTAVHTTTTGAKRTVSKAVKVNKTKATVKKGKTFQIKASEVKDEKKKKIERNYSAPSVRFVKT